MRFNMIFVSFGSGLLFWATLYKPPSQNLESNSPLPYSFPFHLFIFSLAFLLLYFLPPLLPYSLPIQVLRLSFPSHFLSQGRTGSSSRPWLIKQTGP